MYERILVALDGSALAEEVLEQAEAFATRFDSTIVLLRATPLLQSAAVASAPESDPTFVHRTEQQAAAAYLARVGNKLRAKGHAVELRQPEGNPAEQILNQARDAGADLIAIATHGRSGLQRVLLGSVADEVVPKAFCPVLLVRASA